MVRGEGEDGERVGGRRVRGEGRRVRGEGEDGERVGGRRVRGEGEDGERETHCHTSSHTHRYC